MATNFTLTLSDAAVQKLEKLAGDSSMSKADILRRALELFATIQETKETDDIILVDKKTQKPKVKLVLS